MEFEKVTGSSSGSSSTTSSITAQLRDMAEGSATKLNITDTHIRTEWKGELATRKALDWVTWGARAVSRRDLVPGHGDRKTGMSGRNALAFCALATLAIGTGLATGGLLPLALLGIGAIHGARERGSASDDKLKEVFCHRLAQEATNAISASSGPHLKLEVTKKNALSLLNAVESEIRTLYPDGKNAVEKKAFYQDLLKTIREVKNIRDY